MSIITYPDVYNNYLLNVSRGFITGATPFSGYGKRTTTGAETNVIWPNGAYAFPAAAGVQMSLVSTSVNDDSAGTGIRSVELHYLDADLAEQAETVLLDGTTPVLTVATNIRFIQCMHIATVGSGGMAAGTITASNGGNTYSEIATAGVRCASSVRMVPAGKKLFINSMYGGSTSGTATAETIISLASPTFGTHDFTTSNIFIPLADASFQDSSGGISITCPIVFTEGQAVGMTFTTNKAATIVGNWFGWLENA